MLLQFNCVDAQKFVAIGIGILLALIGVAVVIVAIRMPAALSLCLIHNLMQVIHNDGIVAIKQNA